jgi:hypothetical protein
MKTTSIKSLPNKPTRRACAVCGGSPQPAWLVATPDGVNPVVYTSPQGPHIPVFCSPGCLKIYRKDLQNLHKSTPSQ